MLEDIDTREKTAHPSYKNMEQLDFHILLTDNYCVNPNSIHICFPIKIKKKTSESSIVDSDLIPVNNSFAHWVKEISITNYGSDKELIPTFSPQEIYQYTDAMLKHLPEITLKIIEKTHLYSKKRIYYAYSNIDRRIHNGDGIPTAGLNSTQVALAKAKDLNIDDRITKFKDIIQSEHVYRIPLRYFTDLGKINFPTKIDYEIKLHLETKTKRLFESKKLLASGTAIPTPDVKIIFTKAPFIQYEQILLDKSFRQYLETILVSK